MAVTIVVLSADTDPLPSITFDAPRVVIGRGDGADVRLPDPSVSHRHASLRQRGSDYLIVDEGSTNGTYVGAVRLAPQSPRLIRQGELVRVGRIDLEVRLEPGAPVTQGPLATRELALGLVSAALAAQGEALAVQVRAVTRAGAKELTSEVTLQEIGREYVLGRGQGCDLVLDDADCSRRHVGIVRRGNGLFARDLGSKNGTLLRGETLAANKEVLWSPEAELRIGTTILRYEDPLAEALEELEAAADEPVTGQPAEARKRAQKPTPPAPGPWEPSEFEPADDDQASDGATSTSHVPAQLRRPRRPLDPRLTDFLVGSIALIVFVLSLLGLYWLLGS